MEANVTDYEKKPFKLNIKLTMLIGFAFFGILLLWAVYDAWCPPMLTELFTDVWGGATAEEVQYLVGIIMAFDNLAALIILPIFGRLSDKTHTRIGKRMPYILVGTAVCAIAFPFIPVFFHYNNIAGVICMMLIVLIFMMMYRNPAVSLMPDMTPKPLRSKANGLINIMGYIGGAFGTVVGIIFVFTQYTGADGTTWQTGNIWAIELPFLIASLLMVISAVVLFIFVKENKIEEEMADEMRRGEMAAETEDTVDDNAPMTRNNKIMLILILVAEFFWFMADNGISTYMSNYTIYYLGASSSTSSINTIVGGVGSVLGFILGGYIAAKIGRKWSVVSGIIITAVALGTWGICTFALPSFQEGAGSFPIFLYVISAVKGFGLSLIHINSYPMVVELCNKDKVGQFTGYYYASSMAAQTVTPILIGLFLLIPDFGFDFLPYYGFACMILALIVFLFVKNVHNTKTKFKKGLEALDQD